MIGTGSPPCCLRFRRCKHGQHLTSINSEHPLHPDITHFSSFPPPPHSRIRWKCCPIPTSNAAPHSNVMECLQ